MPKKTKIRMLIVAGILLVFVLAIVYPFAVNAARPKQLSFQVKNVYSRGADANSAFDVSVMTRDFVVVEGPCEDGCHGGILAQQDPKDVQELVPSLKGYNGQSTAIIWLYRIKPVEVTRHNDTWGDDTVTIAGVSTREQKIFFAAVPQQIAARPLRWVFVKLK